MATHVDDLLWANRPEVDHIMKKVREILTVGKEEIGTFKLCGRELVQKEGCHDLYYVPIHDYEVE